MFENGPEQAALRPTEGDLASAKDDHAKAFHGQWREDVEAWLRDADAAQAPADMSAEATFNVAEIGRSMGRKNVRTDDPTERIDTKILETVVELDDPKGSYPDFA